MMGSGLTASLGLRKGFHPLLQADPTVQTGHMLCAAAPGKQNLGLTGSRARQGLAGSSPKPHPGSSTGSGKPGVSRQGPAGMIQDALRTGELHGVSLNLPGNTALAAPEKKQTPLQKTNQRQEDTAPEREMGWVTAVPCGDILSWCPPVLGHPGLVLSPMGTFSPTLWGCCPPLLGHPDPVFSPMGHPGLGGLSPTEMGLILSLTPSPPPALVQSHCFELSP